MRQVFGTRLRMLALLIQSRSNLGVYQESALKQNIHSHNIHIFGQTARNAEQYVMFRHLKKMWLFLWDILNYY